MRFIPIEPLLQGITGDHDGFFEEKTGQNQGISNKIPIGTIIA
jgi:hypothetical protein